MSSIARYHTTIAASTATDTVVKASSGRICKVLITTLGTGTCLIYDNASAGSGDLVGSIPASAAVGTIYDFDIPCTNGITVKGNANLPAVTISYR